jgi:hypothetical protein
MVARIVADEDGSIVIPPKIAASIGIASKTEYLVYERDGKILTTTQTFLFLLFKLLG